MYKKFNIIILLVIYSFSSHSQTFEETLSYINIEFKNHLHNPKILAKGEQRLQCTVPMVKNAEWDLSQPLIISKYSENWTVNSVGLLSMEYYGEEFEFKAGTPKSIWYYGDPEKTGRVKLLWKHDIYLKALNPEVMVEKGSCFGDCFGVIMTCQGSKNCIVSNHSDTEPMQSDITDITVYDYALRLKNAIERLIKLAKENDNFIENDPFQK